LSGRVGQTGQPALMARLDEYPDARKAFVEKEHIQSAAVVPLVGSAGVIGTMKLAASSPQYFDQAGVELLLALGRQIALGVEKIRLHESEKRAVALAAAAQAAVEAIESTGDGLLVLTTEGKVISSNRALATMTGYSQEELLGRAAAELMQEVVEPADVDKALAAIAAALEGTIPPPDTVTLGSKDGRQVVVAYSVYLIRNEAGQPTRVVVDVKDVTAAREAEKERQRLSGLYRRLFTYSLDPVCIAGFDGFFKQLNPAWSKPWLEFVHPEDRAATVAAGEQLAAGQAVTSFENRYLCRDGSYRWIAWNSYPLPEERLIFAVTRDITRRKQAEEELRERSRELEEALAQLGQAQERLVRQEKLAMLGQLAGGVGHELRNPLGVISNAVYFLRLVLPDADATVGEYLGIIASEVRKAEKIVADLLDFARTRPATREKVAVSALVEQALQRLPPPMGVKVTTHMTPDLPVVFADAGQISQVLDNLINNAYQSMPEGAS
ncbi:MAG: PAS domain S-box protein, partial [Chloroflexi bacterium]|nr:PAS domain S-box protein [Chloroflexota bacterium]